MSDNPNTPNTPQQPHSPHEPYAFLIALLALLLLSCSTDDTDPLPTPALGTPITFSGSMAEDQSVTRASGLEESQTTFTVYGYKNKQDDASTGSNTSYQTVFPGWSVNWTEQSAYTTTSNTSDWEYVGINDQTIIYWDFGAAAYRFFAYALGSGSSPAPVTAGSASGSDPITLSTTVNGSNADAAPYFSHLWFSDNSSTTVNPFGQPVKLEFSKPFARVRFIFTFFEGSSLLRSHLKDISFKPTDTNKKVCTGGSVTVSYPLTGTGTSETWHITNDNNVTIDGFDIDYYDANASYTPVDSEPTTYDNTPQKWYYVMPQNCGAFTLSVKVGSEETPRTATVPAEYMDWKRGYQYTYIFKITESGDVILDVIQVAISQWIIDKEDNRTVYNW